MTDRFVCLFAMFAVACAERSPPPDVAGDSRAIGTRVVTASSDAWVTVDRLHRRTCPAERCGEVGWVGFREKVTVHEQRDGWARITQHYDASCHNGRSEYVESGDARCVSENGIVDGQFAEWVRVSSLSATRPADPGEGATGFHALVAESDDYHQFGDVFAKAAAELITSGQCSRADFEQGGGWLKSTTRRDDPVYFTYCGGMRRSNRLYLNAATGRVFN